MAGKIKLAFLGSDAIALPLLDWLAGEGSGAEVIAVYTQPDRPAGRGQKVRANAIKAWALARGLPVHQPEKLTEDERAKFAALGADLALVMAYGHILSEAFIATPRLGSLNLHASLLPKYRGASPIQTAVACGESVTGVSLMRIVRRLDAGPVADIETVPIGALDTAADLEGKLAQACVPLVARALPRLAQGDLLFIAQEDARATYCRRLEKEDGGLDFSAPAAALAARINGLFPWPACTVEIAGQSIRLGLADALPSSFVPPGGEADPAAAPGTVLGADAEGLLLATGRGVLRLRRLQRPGGRLLAAAEFLSGFSVPAGTRLPSQSMIDLLVVR
jgi:methionyl-tRNA formyltransferase